MVKNKLTKYWKTARGCRLLAYNLDRDEEERYTKDERSVRKEERILAEEKGGRGGREGEGNTTPEERGGADR